MGFRLREARWEDGTPGSRDGGSGCVLHEGFVRLPEVRGADVRVPIAPCEEERSTDALFSRVLSSGSGEGAEVAQPRVVRFDPVVPDPANVSKPASDALSGSTRSFWS